jgi:integrase
MLLTEFLRLIYVPLRLRGRSPNSVRLLQHAVNQYGRFLGRPATLADLEDLQVARFLTHRGEAVSAHSVERERNGLLALWRLAADRGLLKLRPCVPGEPLPERVPRAFTVDELHRLAAVCRKQPGSVGEVPAAIFWLALLAVLLESGERVHAILHTPRDGWASPWLHVPAHVRKGRARARAYELSPMTAALLDTAAQHGGPLLLAWPYDQATLYNRWKRIAVAAGLGSGREVMFHALRRTCASHLAAAGVDATAYLGHSSDSITRRHYLDPRIVHGSARRPIDHLPRLG